MHCSRGGASKTGPVEALVGASEVVAGCGSALPNPGSGDTASRFGALADWAAKDLSLARLAEGHLDALSILAEAGREPSRRKFTASGRHAHRRYDGALGRRWLASGGEAVLFGEHATRSGPRDG